MNDKIYYHLPGLFEFYDLYKEFLLLWQEHREYFYPWCEIASVYGAPCDCLWGGGRIGFGEDEAEAVLELMQTYGISARLTFSNSLLEREHLADEKCNRLCALFEQAGNSGVIVHSDLLLDYLKKHYPKFYYVSSTTKVLTDFHEFKKEVERSDFRYVVPDFRLNKAFDKLETLSQAEKDKVEFLCNECCWIGCADRKACYENVSRRALDSACYENVSSRSLESACYESVSRRSLESACYENVSRKSLDSACPEHICKSPGASEGYRFSKAMASPAFISVQDILDIYRPMGFTNFKIEGRGLGSALILEFLLYYLTKPEYQLHVREALYLDSMLDLF